MTSRKKLSSPLTMMMIIILRALLGLGILCRTMMLDYARVDAFSSAKVPSQQRNSANKDSFSSSSSSSSTSPPLVHVVCLSEDVWKQAARNHQSRIHELLEPGLVCPDHPLMSSVRKQFRVSEEDNNNNNNHHQWMTMLDPKHPVYNFLVEYYGLKGMKGPKRLARWSPSIGLCVSALQEASNGSNFQRITSLEDYSAASKAHRSCCCDPNRWGVEQERFLQCGIFLEGATPDDFGHVLHLKNAEWIDGSEQQEEQQQQHELLRGKTGVMYRPKAYDDPKEAINKATGLIWYKSVLETTLENDPVLHCYGLHEWAMQYHPEGAPPPPSGKYQRHLPLRVSREVINQTVERKGLRCTHVDALRFFAPAAAPLNKEGSSLERMDQLRLEQPACVHAHMDLLKIALKLTPFCDSDLLCEVLEVALKARALDVGASPYDASSYSTTSHPIRVIPVESPHGRALYKDLQKKLMERAEGIRRDLLLQYEAVLRMTFSEEQLLGAMENPSNDRFARAEPGGLPWRKNLIDRSIDRPEAVREWKTRKLRD